MQINGARTDLAFLQPFGFCSVSIRPWELPLQQLMHLCCGKQWLYILFPTSVATITCQQKKQHAIRKAQWTVWWCLHLFIRHQCVETQPYVFNTVKTNTSLSTVFYVCRCETPRCTSLFPLLQLLEAISKFILIHSTMNPFWSAFVDIILVRL